MERDGQRWTHGCETKAYRSRPRDATRSIDAPPPIKYDGKKPKAASRVSLT
jgi:hypothetical protein